MAHPYLVMRYRLDGVVTVVDAVNGAATLDAHMESVKQVAVADRIVLTKTDLLATPGGRRGQRGPRRPPARAQSGRAHPRRRRAARQRPSACSPAACSIPPARFPTSSAGSRPRPMPTRITRHDHASPPRREPPRRPHPRLLASPPTPRSRPPCSSMFLELRALAARPEPAAAQGHREAAETAGEAPWSFTACSTSFIRRCGWRAGPTTMSAPASCVITRDLDPDAVQALFDAFLGAAGARPARSRRARRQPARAVRRASIADGRSATSVTRSTARFDALPPPGGARCSAPRGRRVAAPAAEAVMGLIERVTADAGHASGARCAPCKMTTPIAKNPTRVFPQVISELADTYGDAPALLSDRESLQLPRACRALQPLRALGADARRSQGRHGLPDDAGPARIPGAVDRRHAGRRRGRAPQHPPDRAGAGPLHQRGEPEAHHRGRGIVRIVARRARLHITGDAKIWLHGEANANFPRIDREVDGLPGDELAASRSAARSPSRIARSTSIRRARPACRRPPT